MIELKDVSLEQLQTRDRLQAEFEKYIGPYRYFLITNHPRFDWDTVVVVDLCRIRWPYELPPIFSTLYDYFKKTLLLYNRNPFELSNLLDFLNDIDDKSDRIHDFTFESLQSWYSDFLHPVVP